MGSSLFNFALLFLFWNFPCWRNFQVKAVSRRSFKVEMFSRSLQHQTVALSNRLLVSQPGSNRTYSILLPSFLWLLLMLAVKSSLKFIRSIWLFSFSSWGLNFVLFSCAENTSVQINAAELKHLLQMWLQLKDPLNNGNSLHQVHKPSEPGDMMRNNREL